jgi:hypothetical protein
MKSEIYRAGLNVLLLIAIVLTLSLFSFAHGAESDEELAKKTQNPIANLISVPLQSNWDFELGPNEDKINYLMNVQPVIPVSLNEKYNLIIRTILPIKANEFPASVGGLGDILQSFFFSPKEPLNGWIIGGGPALLYPTATDEALGGRKWAAGPTAVFLKQQTGWTYGILANHLWSYAGSSKRSDVNATYMQPFLTYTNKSFTTFGVNSESSYDWKNEQWTVPINAFVQQLLRIGGQPLAVQVGYRYYADAPTNGPEWGLRFAVTFLFPK